MGETNAPPNGPNGPNGPNDPGDGRCPTCRAQPALLPRLGALHEDVCPACAGRFVPPEGVERIIVEEHGVSRATLRELVAIFASRERLPCPRCASRMSPVQIRGVRIDLCTGCGGAWLDAGELTRLVEGRHEEVRPPALPVATPAAARAASVSSASGMSDVPAASAASSSGVDANTRVTVFLTTLDAPPPGALSSAFSKVHGLTAMDGAIVARRNDGVAADNVAHHTGLALVKALADEGIAAAVADASWTALPPPFSSNSFLIGDTLRFGGGDAWNSLDASWDDVVAVVAGEVPREALRRVQAVATLAGIPASAGEGELQYQTVSADDALLDVILVGPPRRVRVSRELALFGDAARGRDRSVVFRERVAEIARRAPPTCALGRGPRASQDGGRLPRYRAILELEHEAAWLLWRFHGPGRQA